VLEIAALPDHLLDECDHKSEYVACDVTGTVVMYCSNVLKPFFDNITGLAIPAKDIDSWKASKNYVSPPDNCFYCPLCLIPVEDSNDAWKEHLVVDCTKNARSQSHK
jgi:hypothetical protein